MRARLELPEGQLAAVAAVQTFGDYTSPREVFGMLSWKRRPAAFPFDKRRDAASTFQ